MNDNAGIHLRVDVIVLSRPSILPAAVVVDAIERQSDVTIDLHFHTGWPQQADRNRWQSIARARNEMKQLGNAPWVMFVDDDVVLQSDCIATLLRTLQQSPSLGAIAADYDEERTHPQWDGHVALGACLFRRETLQRLTFRSTEESCECWCCCDDLRSQGIGITYCPAATAIHLRENSSRLNRPGRLNDQSRYNGQGAGRPPIAGVRVLAAFDRRDIGRFEHQFLRSLRAWNNREIVIAVAYGLYPSEIRRLESLQNVQVMPRPANGVMVPVRRLYDFASVTATLSPQTPVAYWDVADVVFQTSLQPLWQEVQTHPTQLLAVAEPKSYPDNLVIVPWTESIHDSDHRRNALELLKHHSFLNSGFAAGTAEVMNRYFQTAHRMRFGSELAGTTDWGDQMCLNIYCHRNPAGWRSIDQAWNYCIHDRPLGEISVNSQGVILSRHNGKVGVAHGNARSLRQFSLLIPQT